MPLQLSKKQLADIIQWDIKNWSKCLDFWEENADLKPNQKVLALGEREGGMSLYFALKGHEVICSDYNPMPDTTKVMHAEYGVADKISYQKIDMKAIKDGGAEFHRIIETVESHYPASSRELSLAKTKIEEAVMWAVKHVTK